MSAFTFVHAADLHLDCPFKGLSDALREHPDLERRVRGATLAAFDALVELCLERDVAFLLMAGDVYSRQDRSLRAVFRFHDGLTRLAERGIPTFVVHGNHDPLAGRLPGMTWPDAVTIFPAGEVRTVPVRRAGLDAAVTVSGISYGSRREARNLAALFPRPTGEGFHIALLHTGIEDQPDPPAYAPCTLETMRDAGYDYWALGHIHAGEVLDREPWIVYAGCTQGMHIREAGPKGCFAVTVDAGRVIPEFVPLSPVCWELLEVSLEPDAPLDALEDVTIGQLEKAKERLAPSCETLIVRLRLNGSGAELEKLAADLAGQAELLERLRETALAGGGLPVWIEALSIEAQATPEARDAQRRRQDFLGEVFRVSAELADDEDALRQLLEPALNELYDSRNARKDLKIPRGEEWRELLDAAENLCARQLNE